MFEESLYFLTLFNGRIMIDLKAEKTLNMTFMVKLHPLLHR